MQLATRSVKDCQDGGDYCTKVVVVDGDTEGSRGKTAADADPLSRLVESLFWPHKTATRVVMRKADRYSLARIHSQRQLR